MKPIHVVACSLISVLLPACSTFELKEGDLSFLKGEKVLNVEYDYSKMSVGSFEDEADYVREKVTERNEDDPGSGDRWRSEWTGNRAGKFEPHFEELLNAQLAPKDIAARRDAGARYTLVLATTHTEPGWNVGISRQPAHINVEVLFYESKVRGKVLAKLVGQRIPGASVWGFDYDVASRLQEAYAKCGKDLGKLLAESL